MRLSFFNFAIFLAACQLSPFDDLEKEASLVAFEPPGGVGEFGGVLTAYTGRSALNEPISRVVGSRGVGFPQVTFSVWDDDGLGRSTSVTERCNDIGAEVPDCPEGASAALVGLSVWRDPDANQRRDCYLASNVKPVRGGDETVLGEGSLRVMCEGRREIFNVNPVGMIDLGTDLAGLAADHPAGVALISATRTPEGGQIYRLTSGGATPQPIPNPIGLTLSASAALGSPLETHAIDSFAGLSSPVVVAAGAPGDSRVVLMVLGDNAGTIELQLLGCVDGVTTRAPRDEVGGEIALGNIDGDAALEIVIGDAANDRLLIAEVPTTPGTCDTPLATTELACPAGATGTPDASCAGSSFGFALAIADVNVDGMADVLVGAPTADVGGDEDSGALYVLPGSAGGPNSGAARVLVPSSVGPGGKLGYAVVAAETQPETAQARFEPVASAPGENAAFVFLCTGLAGDVAVDGNFCIVQ